MAGSEELSEGEHRNRAQLVAERVFRILLTGSDRDVLTAAAWVTEQCDGKLAQAVNVDGPGGGVIIRMTDAPAAPAEDN